MAVNFIQMPLCLRKNINEKSSAYGKYYVEVDNAETLTTEGLVQHIRNHNCAVGEEAIAAVLKKLGECVPELVAQGQPVKIDGLGILTLGTGTLSRKGTISHGQRMECLW
jgi:hypothetical protein